MERTDLTPDQMRALERHGEATREEDTVSVRIPYLEKLQESKDRNEKVLAKKSRQITSLQNLVDDYKASQVDDAEAFRELDGMFNRATTEIAEQLEAIKNLESQVEEMMKSLFDKESMLNSTIDEKNEFKRRLELSQENNKDVDEELRMANYEIQQVKHLIQALPGGQHLNAKLASPTVLLGAWLAHTAFPFIGQDEFFAGLKGVKKS